MDARDRLIIEQNMNDLIQKTNYEQLMQRCLEEKILFDVMKQDIEVIVPTYLLLKKIIKICNAFCFTQKPPSYFWQFSPIYILISLLLLLQISIEKSLFIFICPWNFINFFFTQK